MNSLSIRRWCLALLCVLAFPTLPTFAASDSAPMSDANPPKVAPSAVLDEAAFARITASLDAIVQIKTRAVDNARSLRTLGAEREGSGIVLAPSGLVLTIGYLVLEAESVLIVTNDGKEIPGTVAGYDHATGFGLVKPTVPLQLAGIELGVSSAVSEADRVIFATFGGKDNANLAQVSSKRRFVGYWEYLIDDALFTVPPRPDHQGAALLNLNGKLVGVGSLLVADALVPRRRFPGNMFVPVDLLRPILANLTANTPTKESQRPWLGLNVIDGEGSVTVMRVQDDSPAAKAGLRAGDVIAAVKGEPVASMEDFYIKLWALGSGGISVPLTVSRGSQSREVAVPSIDRADFIRRKSTL